VTEYIRIDDDFEPEIVPERVVWLSDEQFQLEDYLFQRLKEPGAFEFHLILGVAGTGKTQVLLSLGDDLREAGQQVVLGISQSLKKTLTDAGFQIKSDTPVPGAIHLIDDPNQLGDIKSAYKFAKACGARAVVISIDPFQWTHSRSLMKFAAYFRPEMGDAEYIDSHRTLKRFRDILYGVKPEAHWLRTVFRQSGRAGSKALELSKLIFENMNPFGFPDKKEEFVDFTKGFVDELLVKAEFVNDEGDLIVTETNAPTQELWERIAKHVQRTDRWYWTESALVVPLVSQLSSKWSEYSVPIPGFSDQEGFDPDIQLVDAFGPLKIRYALYDFPASVRGEEFQDVIISVPNALWKKMHQQKTGLGSNDWAEIMPLHVYITRGKDLVQIVVGDSESNT
jgi:hypothetical protein